MLFEEDKSSSSPTFKLRQRSEGQDIFEGVEKEEIGEMKISQVQEESVLAIQGDVEPNECLYKKEEIDEASLSN